MIHYTLKGPRFKLEIHEDKLYLKRKTWWKLFSSKKQDKVWEINELKSFNITSSKSPVWGKLKWESQSGLVGELTFHSNEEIVKKIELYFHKKILKMIEKKELALKALAEVKPIAISSKQPRKSKKNRRQQQDIAA